MCIFVSKIPKYMYIKPSEFPRTHVDANLPDVLLDI